MTAITATQVLLAGVVDLMIGDPRWLPHPVRLMGRAIGVFEDILRRFCSSPRGERFSGILLVLAIVLPVYLVSVLAMEYLGRLSSAVTALIASAVLIYLTATTIAARELIFSVRQVIVAIEAGDLEAGRRHVSMIVGRDTNSLDERSVLKAAIESLAENLSDGVVAPLFYLAIGGLPLALAYKAVNTLDSMVGYKNDRYRYFGWAAARFDDIANYLPARLTGALISASILLFSLLRQPDKAFRRASRSFAVMLRDGRKHPSPNSGFPEAAMAGALGIRLGGPSTYGGIACEKPFIGDGRTSDFVNAAKRALSLAHTTAVAAMLLAALAAGVRSII
jgi:adenosylcobinamide-phosphate synthase